MIRYRLNYFDSIVHILTEQWAWRLLTKKCSIIVVFWSEVLVDRNITGSIQDNIREINGFIRHHLEILSKELTNISHLYWSISESLLSCCVGHASSKTNLVNTLLSFIHLNEPSFYRTRSICKMPNHWGHFTIEITIMTVKQSVSTGSLTIITVVHL